MGAGLTPCPPPLSATTLAEPLNETFAPFAPFAPNRVSANVYRGGSEVQNGILPFAPLCTSPFCTGMGAPVATYAIPAPMQRHCWAGSVDVFAVKSARPCMVGAWFVHGSDAGATGRAEGCFASRMQGMLRAKARTRARVESKR